MTTDTMPVLRRWIDQQATVYLTPPTRTLLSDDGEDQAETDAGEAWASLESGAAYDERWRQLDQAVHLYGAAVGQWVWNTWRRRLEMRVVSPDVVHVVPDPDDPGDLSRAWAVLIELNTADGISGAGSRRFLAYWRAEDENGRSDWQSAIMHEDGRLELDGDDDAQDLTSPIRDGEGRSVLPLVLIRKADDPSVLWPTPPVDMIDGQDTVNSHWVDLIHRARQSGYGSWVAAGFDPERLEQALNLAPGGVTIVQEGETVSAITTDSKLAEHLELLQDYLLQQAQRLGLPPSAWKPRDQAPASGFALRVENLEAETHRAQQVGRFRRIEEQDGFAVARSVWNTYAVPEGADLIGWELRLNWRPGPTSLPTDEEAQLRLLSGFVDRNWLTSAQAMARALGLSEQGAAEMLAANVEANRSQIKPAGGGLAEAALGITAAATVADETAPASAPRLADEDQPVAEEGAPVAAPEEDVAKSALNGAQIKSLVDLVAQVGEGLLTRKAAVEIIQVSFPTVDRQTAERLVP